MDCIGQKPLSALLAEKCEQNASREFIVFQDRDGRQTTITYRLFENMVNQYAAILHANGIKKADRVMLVMMNCPEFIAAWFALARIGAVCMPINVLAGTKELNVIADFTEAAAVITEPRYTALVAGVTRIPRVFVTRTASWYPNVELFPKAVVLDAGDAPTAVLPDSGVSADDDALILVTAGSDSELRAVVLTHANALFAGMFGQYAWQLTPQDRHLMVLPLFHINALFISVMPILTAGATLIMTISSTKIFLCVRCARTAPQAPVLFRQMLNCCLMSLWIRRIAPMNCSTSCTHLRFQIRCAPILKDASTHDCAIFGV
jgi:crotonobetaine/carnitine-CoA ligase